MSQPTSSKSGSRHGSATRLKPVPPLQLGPSLIAPATPKAIKNRRASGQLAKKSTLVIQASHKSAPHVDNLPQTTFKGAPSYVARKAEKTALVSASLKLQRERLEAPVVVDERSGDRPFEGEDGEKLSFANPPGCWPGSSRKPRSISQRLGTAPSSERGRVDAATALISEFIKDFGLRSRPEAASWLRLNGLENTLVKVQKRELEVYEPVRLSQSHLEQGVHKWTEMENEIRELATVVEEKRSKSALILESRLVSVRKEIAEIERQLAVVPKEFELAERRAQIVAQQQVGVSAEIKKRRILQNSYEELLRTSKQLAMGAQTTRENIESCRGWADRRKQEVIRRVEETLHGHRNNVTLMQNFEGELGRTKERVEEAIQRIAAAKEEAERLRNETVLWRSRVEAGVVERSEALTPRPEPPQEQMAVVGFQGLETTVERMSSLDSRIATVYSYLRAVQHDASVAKKKSTKLSEKQSYVCPFTLSALPLMGSKLDYLHKISTGPSLALPTPHWSDEELWDRCRTLWQHVQGSGNILPFTMKEYRIKQACMNTTIARELEIEDAQQDHHLELVLASCLRAGQLAGGFEEVLCASGIASEAQLVPSPTKVSHAGNVSAALGTQVTGNSSVMAASFIFHEMVNCRAPIRLLEFHSRVLSALNEYLLRADVQNSGRILRSLADLCGRQACNEFNLPALSAIKCAAAIRSTITVRISLGPTDPSGDLFYFSTELMRQLCLEQAMLLEAVRHALLKRSARTIPIGIETTGFYWPYAIETTLLYPLLEDIYYIPASNKMVNRNSPEILQSTAGSDEGTIQAQIYRLNGNQLVKQWTQACRRVSADKLKGRIQAQQSRENSPPDWCALGGEQSTGTAVQKKIKGYVGQIQTAARGDETTANIDAAGLSPSAGNLEFNLPKNRQPLVSLQAEETARFFSESDTPTGSSAGPSASETPTLLSPTTKTSQSGGSLLLKSREKSYEIEKEPKSKPTLLPNPKAVKDPSIPEMKDAHKEPSARARKWIDSWNNEQIKQHEAQETAMIQSTSQSTRAANRRQTSSTRGGATVSPTRALPALQISTELTGGALGSPIASAGPGTSPRTSGSPGGMRVGIPAHWDYLYDVSELLAVLEVIPLRAFLTPFTAGS